MPQSLSLEKAIKKHTLKNAFDYGKAIASKVVGKVIVEVPSAKEDMKKTMGLIEEEVKRVNSLTKEQIASEMREFEYEERIQDDKKELTLPDAIEGKVITRFPPEPSGYLHIGHAKAAWLDYSCAVRYNGKMILRFDDTNPEKEKQEYVDAIKEGLSWLGIKWFAETYTSDKMEVFYEMCVKLIEKGKAFACTCSPEEIKKGRESKERCACAYRSFPENIALFEGMRSGNAEEGKAIIRFLGDMQSENSVMRDPTLFRINKKEHYRQGKKYSCWPSYDFAAPIMDALEGVTHAMRSKEYELRNELYFAILRELGLRQPKLIEFSRLSIKNSPVSKRLITPLIEQKKVSGWDDPRLPTLVALKRRGVLPEAIKEFVLSFGLSKVESEPSLDALYAENRKLLDKVAMRRFFVSSPVRLVVHGASARTVLAQNHPKNPAMGSRKLESASEFWISGTDAASFAEGEKFRLKELYNVKVVEKRQGAVVAKYDADEGAVDKKIQWVPVETAVKCEVLRPSDLFDSEGVFRENSMEVDSGFCEKSCLALDEGSIIQFERYGYARLDKKEAGGLRFIFSC